MSQLPTTASRLFHRSSAKALSQPDPADMGCCLGLELSQGAVMPARPELVAAPPAASDRPAHWWQRLHLSKPAHA